MEKTNSIKILLTGIGAFLSAKLGLLWVVIPFLLVAMIIDYTTGILAARKEDGTSSKIGMWGIVKKLCYGVEVAIGVIIDWLIINVTASLGVKIPTCTFFGLLVAIWLILNEIRSILENLVRLDVPLPTFLKNVVANFKIVIEKKGDSVADSFKQE